MPMTAHPLEIPDVLLLVPEVHADSRGDFFEAWNDETFHALAGPQDPFVQDNQSTSARGVVRGLHYQLPNPQGKLVRVIAGKTFSVAVDIRRSSATFGVWVSSKLSAANRRQLWIPPGFAHGFVALKDQTEMIYKVTQFYTPGGDRAIRWDDPAIGIDWPLDLSKPVLSDKDRRAPLLADAEVFD